jgi:hypothetical protein
MRKRCRHCDKKPISRPRQLCWDCYYTPGVRDLYPVMSKYARCGPGSVRARARPPAFPTNARPGSLAKILVLTQRAELGQDLWHPDDATLFGSKIVGRVG